MKNAVALPKIDESVITLFQDKEFSGKQWTFPVGSNIPDFSAKGVTGISGIAIPAGCNVILYYADNYAISYGGQTFLCIHNGWDSVQWIDFKKGKIGQFQPNLSGLNNSFGYDYNDATDSMQSSKSSLDGYQYIEVQQQGARGVGGEVGASIYQERNGQNFLTHFSSSDKNFGPAHNDSASSIAVPWGCSADLFGDNNYSWKLGTYDGNMGAAMDQFRIRIYNLNDEHNNQASSLKTSIKLW